MKEKQPTIEYVIHTLSSLCMSIHSETNHEPALTLQFFARIARANARMPMITIFSISLSTLFHQIHYNKTLDSHKSLENK